MRYMFIKPVKKFLAMRNNVILFSTRDSIKGAYLSIIDKKRGVNERRLFIRYFWKIARLDNEVFKHGCMLCKKISIIFSTIYVL